MGIITNCASATVVILTWILMCQVIPPAAGGAISPMLNDKGMEVGSMDRQGRFVFTLIRFPNSYCGSGLNSGTCFTSSECSAKGGTDVSSCAKGYGTCCKVTTTTCGGDITMNNTWVQNAEYPDYYNEARTCTWKVHFDNTPGKICQIRYDFGTHSLYGPSSTGYCNNDQLVFNDDTKSNWFCGVAPDNYHWYVDTLGTTSPHSFTIKTDSTSFSRRYAMRVSFIPCKLDIPPKCGQYFTGLSGTIVSYNYNQNSYYLAGLSYSMCFRKELGYCTYTMEKTGDNQYIGETINRKDLLRFMMGNGITSPMNPALPPALGQTCSSTAIEFQQLYYTAAQCLYPDSMTSVQRTVPFFVTVRTELDTIENRNPFPFLVPFRSGFEFNWKHNKCS